MVQTQTTLPLHAEAQASVADPDRTMLFDAARQMVAEMSLILPPCLRREYALLIVRAVNAHDELLDLATGLLALVEAFAPDMAYHDGLIDAAKARLAKVQP